MNNIALFLAIIALSPLVSSAMEHGDQKIDMKGVIGRVRAKSDARPETMTEVKKALTLREQRAEKMKKMQDLTALINSIKVDSK